MPVTAWIDGNVCGQAETIAADDQIVYVIHVQAEGSGDFAGCGAIGRAVAFQIGEQMMTQGTTWDDSRMWALDLSERLRLYMPLMIQTR